MFNVNSVRIAIIALLACTSISATAKIASEEVVHVTAMSITKNLGVGELSVPKVFVLSRKGVLQFESKRDSTPDDSELYRAIDSSAPVDGEPHLLTKVLSGFSASAEAGANVVVSIETGASIGICPGCENYYPEFKRRLGETKASVRWIRVRVEKNDFQVDKNGAK